MGGKQEVPQHLAGFRFRPLRLFKDLPNGEKVPQGLGHLLLVDLHEAVMNPVAREFLSRCTTRLGNLVLMMGKDQIHPAAVDIEGLAEMSNGHGGTLNMPAGPSLPPRTRPGRLTGLGTLPEGEIHRMAFPLIYIHPRACLEIIQSTFGEPAVIRILCHFKVDVPIHLVCQTLPNQSFGQPHNVGHMLSRFGFDGRRPYAQFPHVIVIGLNEFGRDLVTTHTLLVRPLNNLVIDVGEILGKLDPIAGVFEIPANHIEYQRAPRMPDMAIVIDRHAAHIHPHGLRHERLERLLLSTEGIVDPEHESGLIGERGDVSANETRETARR